MTTQGYAHLELLAETEWLAEHLGDPDIRIVDCDLPDAYFRAHIPGAVNVGANHYLKGPDEVHVMPPEQAAAFMGDLGIGDDTMVVAYDNRYGVYAARLWWALSYYGHTKVKVLNGGWRRWLAEGRPATDRATAGVPRAKFTPKKANESLIVRADTLKGAIGKKGTAIWDVRSLEEYTGENTRGNKYGGHIPGACHMEWSNVVDTVGLGTFRPAGEIRKMLAQIGVTPEKQVFTH